MGGSVLMGAGKCVFYGFLTEFDSSFLLNIQHFLGQSTQGVEIDPITGLDPNVNSNFASTRYFTHFSWGLAATLATQPGYLNDDGTTDGGCEVTPLWAIDKCPNGELS